MENKSAVAPPLRIAELDATPPETEPIVASRPAPRGPLERRTFIDQPHLTVRGYDWPMSTEPAATGSESANRPAIAERTRIRVDQGTRRQPGASTKPMQRMSSPDAAKPTMAAKVFQLHAAAAPHAGVAMTLALVLSVGFLCWLTFGHSNVAINYDKALDMPGGWPAETATQSPPTDTGINASAGAYIPEFAWRVTPPGEQPAITADAAPAPVATAESAESTIVAPQLALSQPPGAAVSTAAPAPVAAAPVAVAPAVETPEPITPTPTGTSYPTTPYGEFNYFAQGTTTPGAVVDQTAVAARPSPESASAAATR